MIKISVHPGCYLQHEISWETTKFSQEKSDLFSGALAKSLVDNHDKLLDTDYTFSDKMTCIEKIIEFVLNLFTSCFNEEEKIIKDNVALNVFKQIDQDLNDLLYIEKVRMTKISGSMKKPYDEEWSKIEDELENAVVPILDWIIVRKENHGIDVTDLKNEKQTILTTIKKRY